MPPDLSIVIPVYNRGDLVHYTLESVARASRGLAVEVVVIDDGSEPPAAEAIARLGYAPTRSIRQDNRGLLFARLAGLAAATGRYVMFLDSDDLVSGDKLRLQVSVMDSQRADLSYTDAARCALNGDFDRLSIIPEAPYEETADPATFYITIQPAPHSPVFRTDYLQRIVAEPLFPPKSLYNSVAEIWFYHNAALKPARVVKVPGPYAIGGAHPGVRLTGCWERLGVASLGVMEAFARACPETPDTAHVRQLVAEKAFVSWRRLPSGFSTEFAERELGIWRRLRRETRTDRLGGRGFRTLAAVAGAVGAARLLRWWQARPYEPAGRIGDAEFRQLLSALPEP